MDDGVRMLEVVFHGHIHPEESILNYCDILPMLIEFLEIRFDFFLLHGNIHNAFNFFLVCRKLWWRALNLRTRNDEKMKH
jgi:hypothetical protein